MINEEQNIQEESLENPIDSINPIDLTQLNSNVDIESDHIHTEDVTSNQVAVLKDQLMRSIADLENIRRRKDLEIRNILEYSNERLLKDILPILDDITRSVATGFDKNNFEVLFNGVSLIKDNFEKLVLKYDVKKIECLGLEFDVNFHEALLNQPSEAPEGTIISELEPGYFYKDKVIRHSKVIVSSGS